MKIEDQIAVMQHYLAGGLVESRYVGDDTWDFSPHPAWNFRDLDYRPKATPKADVIRYDFVRSPLATYSFPTLDACDRQRPTQGHPIVKLTFDGDTMVLKNVELTEIVK